MREFAAGCTQRVGDFLLQREDPGMKIDLSDAMKTATTEEIVYTCLLVAGGILFYQLLFIFLRRWGERQQRMLPTLLNRYIYYPGFLIILLVTLWMALSIAERHFEFTYYLAIRHGLKLLGIAAGALMVMRSISFFSTLALESFTSENPLDYSIRKAKTKFQLIERIPTTSSKNHSRTGPAFHPK
jgi:hypothetical protein